MKGKKFLDPEKRGMSICPRLYVIRGVEVMLDSELAALFQMTTKRINEVVRRHKDRFSNDFVFKLTDIEFKTLRSQIATSKSGGYIPEGARKWMERRGGRRHLPHVFTSLGFKALEALLKWDLED